MTPTGDQITQTGGAAVSCDLDAATPAIRSHGPDPAAPMRAARRLWDASAPEREAPARPGGGEPPHRLVACMERLAAQLAADPGPAAQRLGDDLAAAAAPLSSPQGATSAARARAEDALAAAEEALGALFVKRAAAAAPAVMRVVDTRTGRGLGAGTLVAPGVLLTHATVLGHVFAAAAAVAEIGDDGTPRRYAVEPRRLFDLDPVTGAALVALSPRSTCDTPLSRFAPLPLVPAPGKIRRGAPVNLVHPLPGGGREIAVGDWRLVALPGDPGTLALFAGGGRPPLPGAPLFSDRWEIVALHRSAIPDADGDGAFLNVEGRPWSPADDPDMRGLRWVGAEGARISAVAAGLARAPARRERGADLVRAALAAGRLAEPDGLHRPAPVGRPPMADPGPDTGAAILPFAAPVVPAR